MAKGDDIERRKKNKANRKKLNRQRDSSSVSSHVASIIAAKKRRLSGRRRMCQGMCYSLPTPDDPYNDRNDKKRLKESDAQRSSTSLVDKKVPRKVKKAFPKITSTHDCHVEVESYEEKVVFSDKQEKVACISNAGHTEPINSRVVKYEQDGQVSADFQTRHLSQAELAACPSKYLITCLKAIENVMWGDNNCNGQEDKHLLVNSWGVEFWKLFSSGNDILETSGSSVEQEQVAWMVSIAADAISRREKEGLAFANPFLLYLVPTKEKALKVRALCKPLKTLGIHTVSIHSGASLDHQINGLGSCEPEFLVSTPERLLELVSLKAINISAVAFLVIEGVCLPGSSYLNATKSIRQAILKKPQTVLFSRFSDLASIHSLQSLLPGSISRLSLNDSVASRSACIIQSINVCSSKEEKMVKGMNALNCAHDNLPHTHPSKVLCIVKRASNFEKLISSMNFKGRKTAISTMDTDEITNTDLGEYGVVIIPDFVISMDSYVQILTGMARRTVGGILQTFLTQDDAPHASPLIELLEQCGQEVPEALRNSHVTA